MKRLLIIGLVLALSVLTAHAGDTSKSVKSVELTASGQLLVKGTATAIEIPPMWTVTLVTVRNTGTSDDKHLDSFKLGTAASGSDLMDTTSIQDGDIYNYTVNNGNRFVLHEDDVTNIYGTAAAFNGTGAIVTIFYDQVRGN
jgi:hypothetical protein